MTPFLTSIAYFDCLHSLLCEQGLAHILLIFLGEAIYLDVNIKQFTAKKGFRLLPYLLNITKSSALRRLLLGNSENREHHKYAWNAYCVAKEKQ